MSLSTDSQHAPLLLNQVRGELPLWQGGMEEPAPGRWVTPEEVGAVSRTRTAMLSSLQCFCLLQFMSCNLLDGDLLLRSCLLS